MSASRPAPVRAAEVTLEQRRALDVRVGSLTGLPTSADTVVAFGKPVPARAMLGTSVAAYSRASRTPAPPLHPMLSRTGVTV